MERKKILDLLKENLKNDNLIKHCLAVESAMVKLAKHFSKGEENKSSSSPFAIAREDQEKWGTCGLLHDIDYEKTKEDAKLHSKVGSEMLKDLGFDEEICQAVLTHNEIHGIEPKTLMAKALYCVDPLTGLIVAATLVLPAQKIKELKVENILKRFKEKAFARGVNREIIAQCPELLDLSLEDFIKIVLLAMQDINKELEL